MREAEQAKQGHSLRLVFTEANVLDEFRRMFGYFPDGKRTPKDFAEHHGLSKSYISEVLNGKKGIADKLAKALGFEREVQFFRIPVDYEEIPDDR